jgi:acylphosphatase
MMEKIFYRVTGRVQGVFFRACTRDAALDIGAAGWVRNAADGSVEGEAFGEPEVLESFIAWLHEGSPHSRVDRVEIEDREPAANAPDGFEIRY